MRTRLGVLATVIGLLVATTAQAGHHLWDLTEMFSNASGTIQFIELFTAAADEQGVGPFTVTSTTHTFNFVTNLPSNLTANTWILIATSNFASPSPAIDTSFRSSPRPTWRIFETRLANFLTLTTGACSSSCILPRRI